jgi:hypothetical protein
MPKTKKPQSKTAFVLSLPPTLSAKEVLAKGKAAGLKLSEKYVYVIRSKAKAGGKRKGRRPGKGKGTPSVAGLAGAIDARFATLVLDIGLARADAILKNLRAKARSAAQV